MKLPLIHPDFLLETEAARGLYHDVAVHLPIIDYHCHLDPETVATDHRFRSMTELWLAGDHYKWRAMRAAGENERFCTGEASDWEKFQAWARVVPKTLRNPLYHWTHLELAFPFGINDRLLGPETAQGIYTSCNDRLGDERFFAQGLMGQFKVEVVCTTDDPVDDLSHHLAHARGPQPSVRLLPTWRPDAAIAVDDVVQYNSWLDRLERASGITVLTLRDLLDALGQRHQFFHDAGCRLSDHGLDRVYASGATIEQVGPIFKKLRAGQPCSRNESIDFKSALLVELARMDHARGWVQQFHVGALRNVNSRLERALGPNTGFDSIGDHDLANDLGQFLDRLDSTDQLAKTILYNLNPRDNELFATMIGNFQDGSSAGKMQYGSAWWFLDQLDGMEKQLNALSNLGLLSQFVGMLTDSRSFVSYSRHDYFRRLLCNLLGNDVRRGLLPNDWGLLSGLVRDLCYENAKRYFAF